MFNILRDDHPQPDFQNLAPINPYYILNTENENIINLYTDYSLDRQPWNHYEGYLTFECNAGIETITGILIDSGASKSCFKNLENFTGYTPISNRVLKVASCQTIPILGVGTVLFTREKAIINIDGNIKIIIPPSNCLYTLGQHFTSDKHIKMGQSGLYSCDCTYYQNKITKTLLLS